MIGLAGTGSHDFRFRDAFIPAHRTWFPGKPPHGEALDGPLFRTPYLGGPFALPSVVLGIAIAGLEHFAALTQGRPARQGGGLADLQSMQMRIGESAVEIDAALALLRVKLKEMMATLSGNPPDSGGERAVLPAGGVSHGHDLAVSSFIAHTAYGALNRLMIAAGAGQLAASEPFQRCFRDALAGIAAAQQQLGQWPHHRRPRLVAAFRRRSAQAADRVTTRRCCARRSNREGRRMRRIIAIALGLAVALALPARAENTKIAIGYGFTSDTLVSPDREAGWHFPAARARRDRDGDQWRNADDGAASSPAICNSS